MPFNILSTQKLQSAPASANEADSPNGSFVATQLTITDTTPAITGGRIKITEGATSEEARIIRVASATQLIVEELVNTYTSAALVTMMGASNAGDPTGSVLAKNSVGVLLHGSKNKAETFFNIDRLDLKGLWQKIVSVVESGLIEATSLVVGSTATTPGDRSVELKIDATDSRILKYVEADDQIRLEDQDGELVTLEVADSTSDNHAVNHGQLTAEMATIDRAKIPIRHTVLSGPTNNNNVPNLITTGSGLNAGVNAATTNAILTFAQGFNDNGMVDIVKKLTTNQQVACQAGTGDNHIFAELLGDGSVQLGATPIIPVYSTVPPRDDSSKNMLLHFEGSDGSNVFTDEHGNVIGTTGTPTLTTSTKRYGASSLDATSGRLVITDANFRQSDAEGFSLEFSFMKPAIVTTPVGSAYAQNPLVGCVGTNGGGLQLYIDGTGVMRYHLSSSTSSWTIINGGLGSQPIQSGVWYDFQLSWDKLVYRGFVNGQPDYSISSSLRLALGNNLTIGGNSYAGNNFGGYIDELRYTQGRVRNTATYTPTALQLDDHFWFNLYEYRMKQGNVGSGWNNRDLLFLGQVNAGASSLTNAVTYAYRGYHESDWFNVAGSTEYPVIHNLGTMNYHADGLLKETPQAPNRIFKIPSDGVSAWSDYQRNQVRIATMSGQVGQSFSGGAAQNLVSGQAKVFIRRGF